MRGVSGRAVVAYPDETTLASSETPPLVRALDTRATGKKPYAIKDRSRALCLTDSVEERRARQPNAHSGASLQSSMR